MDENLTEFDIASNERQNDAKQTNEVFERFCELFSPVRDQWPFIQDILLWRNIGISVIVFNILNVLFWIFLTPRLKVFVGLAILLSLLWLTPPIRHWILLNTQSLSAKPSESVDSDDAEVLREEEFKSSGKITSYEDFCYGMAVIWSFVIKYWIRLKSLKEENSQKFYLVVSLLVVMIAVVYAQFPIGSILYMTVISLYLWPAIVFHGIKDIVVRKLQKLVRPFFTQWQSSRTKRKRAVFLKDPRQSSDVSEDEDFTLNATQTEAVPSSAVTPGIRHRPEQPTDALDSVNSSLTFIDGLEFPSLRRDSAESINSDDFVEGLNFGGVTLSSHHSSMDSLVEENDATTHSQTDEALRSRTDKKTQSQNDNLLTSVKYIPPESPPDYHTEVMSSDYHTEVRHRTNDQLSSGPQLRKKSSDDDDFEVISTSEIQVDVDKDNEQQEQEGSYISSGTAYMGKLFGYSS